MKRLVYTLWKSKNIKFGQSGDQKIRRPTLIKKDCWWQKDPNPPNTDINFEYFVSFVAKQAGNAVFNMCKTTKDKFKFHLMKFSFFVLS